MSDPGLDARVYSNLPPREGPNFIPDFKYRLEKKYLDDAKCFSKTLAYIWFDPQRGIWVYPVIISEEYVSGFGWHGSKWIALHVPRDAIIAYY